MKILLKNRILIVAFVIYSVFANAQDSLPRKFFKITSVIKPQRLNEVKLTKGIPLNNSSKCLIYKCGKNANVSFCNDKSDENYVEFQELGQIEKNRAFCHK